MNVNFDKLKEQVVNSLSGLSGGMGFSLRLFDENGEGPISSSKNTKYIDLKDFGLMIKLPNNSYSDNNEIIIYKGSQVEVEDFKKILQRLKSVGLKHGVTVNIRSFNSPIVPKKLAGEIKAKSEEESISESITSFPHISNFLD